MSTGTKTALAIVAVLVIAFVWMVARDSGGRRELPDLPELPGLAEQEAGNQAALRRDSNSLKSNREGARTGLSGSLSSGLTPRRGLAGQARRGGQGERSDLASGPVAGVNQSPAVRKDAPRLGRPGALASDPIEEDLNPASDPIVRAEALGYVDSLEDPNLAESIVIESLEDRNPTVRAAAVEALPSVTEELSADLAAQIIADPALEVREAAVAMLSNYGDENVQALIEQATYQNMVQRFTYGGSDERMDVLSGASDLPAWLSLDLIERGLSDNDPEVRLVAFGEITSVMDEQPPIKLLRQVLRDRDPAVRLAALESISDIEDRELQSLVRRVVDDSDEDVRGKARELLDLEDE